VKILIFATLLFFLFATPAQAQVVISEVYPAPTSEEKEWVELYNTSDQIIDISGWKLFEHFANKNELVTFTDILIEPHAFFVYELTSNKLNNSEEKISLENIQIQEVSSLYYINSESQKSFSYLFTNNTTISEHLEITTPTKAERNPIYVVPTPTPTPTPSPSSTSTPTTSPSTTETNTQAFNPNSVGTVLGQTELQPTPTPINKQLVLHQKIHASLNLPSLTRIPKKNLETYLPQLSYLVQDKISQQGVTNAIIGGSLLLLSGLLL
jgi:predicted extracellular nuclease